MATMKWGFLPITWYWQIKMGVMAFVFSALLHLALFRFSSLLSFSQDINEKTTEPIFVMANGKKNKLAIKAPFYKGDMKNLSIENGTTSVAIPGNSKIVNGEQTIGVAEILKNGNSLPLYPREASERGWQGTVQLKLSLSQDGDVMRSEIIKSSGFPLLDLSASKASEKWKFKGNPKTKVIYAPVNFILD